MVLSINTAPCQLGLMMIIIILLTGNQHTAQAWRLERRQTGLHEQPGAFPMQHSLGEPPSPVVSAHLPSQSKTRWNAKIRLLMPWRGLGLIKERRKGDAKGSILPTLKYPTGGTRRGVTDWCCTP
jgi:hypothetical protein